MFQEKALVSLYCVSPLHPGAGTSLGAVDNPIQRERHTYHPTMAGSGIKGALRDHFDGNDRDRLLVIFGPESEAGQSSTHAGAMSFSDAQMVLFPVRSLEDAFVYVSSPTVLARFQRLARIAGFTEVDEWDIPRPEVGKYIPLSSEWTERLILESFEFEKSSPPETGREISQFISNYCLPAHYSSLGFFRKKIACDTLVLNDLEFTHFVKHSTLVEPHVRIEDASGTAEERGLFYVENIPPETVMVSLLMASKSRRKGLVMAASEVIDTLAGWLVDEHLVQMGGDSTTGRGQVLVTVSRKEA